ncbi:MAG: hypothetical protein ACSLE1_02780 [Sphingobium sp.]
MTKSTGSLLEHADYTEDNVAVVLERFLTLLSFPRDRFSIEVISRSKERYLGADARLNGAIRGFRPFYMQFKRPSAYPERSSSRIITDRTKLGVGSWPHALFFGLRDKKPSQSDLQHNILYRLRRRLIARGLGEAAYVCPLFLDHAAYRSAAHQSGLFHLLSFWRRTPWYYRDFIMRHDGSPANFDRIPILAEHVTIPPHVTVTSSKHHYSFNEQGRDLCFHEPTVLPEDASAPLGTFIAREFERAQGEDGKVSIEESQGLLKELIAEVYGDRATLDAFGDNPIGRWYAFGAQLKRDFGIVQYAFVRWDESFF